MKKYTHVHENEPFAKGKFTNENYLFGQKILRLDKIDFDWRKNRPLTIDFHLLWIFVGVKISLALHGPEAEKIPLGQSIPNMTFI